MKDFFGVTGEWWWCFVWKDLQIFLGCVIVGIQGKLLNI